MPGKRPRENFGTSQGHPGHLGRFMWKFQFKGQNVCGTDGAYDGTDGTCPWDRRDRHQGVSIRNFLCVLVFPFPTHASVILSSLFRQTPLKHLSGGHYKDHFWHDHLDFYYREGCPSYPLYSFKRGPCIWARWGSFVVFSVLCLLAYGDIALKS